EKVVDLKLRQCRRGDPAPCARSCRYLRNWMILNFLYNNYFLSILVSQEPCRMRKSVVVLFLIFVISLISLQAASNRAHSADPSIQIPGVAINAMQKIDPERIRAHVRFLSHDLLEGRGTGQRGGDIAAEYIATQFALDGLQPAGDNGTFLQKVPMVGVTPDPATTFSLVGSSGPAKDLKPLIEYVAYNETQQPESDADAEIVYVGYGIEAPEYAWDDYKGADVKGKVLLMLVNEPPSRSFHPAPLDVSLKAHMVSKIRPFESNNVIAKLPGSDSKLKNGAIMYTAHYDHLGIRPPMPGDNIYNGASDNATGYGILLELARTFSLAAQAPRRSIIFASVTAEEQGLLGSEYLGKHPPVPAGGIALDLNYDDVPPLGSPEEVEVSGSERT